MKCPILIRFALVGVLNTGFGYGIYCLALLAGAPYWLATLVANVLGVMFNFKTTGVLVFKNHDNGLFFRFVSCYVIAYFINVGLIALLKWATNYGEYVCGFVAMMFTAMFSFLFLRYFVFYKKSS